MSRLLSLVSIDELANVVDVIRAGVIPYAIDNGVIYWLMGINHKQLLTDFGGGCGKYESALTCLLRETREEAGDYIADIVYDSIIEGEGLILWKAQSRRGPPYRYLLFVPIPIDDYQEHFVPNDEIYRLTWITQDKALSTKITSFHDPLIQYMRQLQAINN